MAKEKLTKMELPGFQLKISGNSGNNAEQIAALEQLQTGLAVMEDCFALWLPLFRSPDLLSCLDLQETAERIQSELWGMKTQNRFMYVQLKRLTRLYRDYSTFMTTKRDDPFEGLGDWDLDQSSHGHRE